LSAEIGYATKSPGALDGFKAIDPPRGYLTSTSSAIFIASHCIDVPTCRTKG
jgi:hypothetical protein